MRDSRPGRASITDRLRKRLIVLASIPAGLGWLIFGNAPTVHAAVCIDCTFFVTAEPITSLEGQAFTDKEVGTFTDETLLAGDKAGDYSATITWETGQTTAGTIKDFLFDDVNQVASGTVVGSYTYVEEGSRNFTVHVSRGSGNSKVNRSNTANSATTDSVAVTAKAITATEGSTFDGVVATFTTEDPSAVAADFNASVNFESQCFEIGRPNPARPGAALTLDPAAVTIVKNGSLFEVHSSHTYAEEGPYSTCVSVVDVDGLSEQHNSGTAAVANAALTVTQTINQSTSEGGGGIDSAVLAKFADANGDPDAKDFSATINWGDGATADTGAIGGNKTDGFTVTGSHSYDEGGTYTVTVTITDNKVGTGEQKATVSGTLTATVTDKPLEATGKTATSTEGAASTPMVVIATFTDSNSDDVLASNYTATVDWKDGSALTTCSSTSTTCTISSNSENHNFEIKSSHSYAEENTAGYKPHVTVTDKGGATASADATVKVNDAALTAANGPAINVQKNQSTGNVVTATFTDANSHKDKADFTATIDWGDSNTSAGTVSVADNGTFSVTGSHTYTSTGSFTVKTSISDTGSSTASATAAASVAAPPTLATTGASWLIPPGAGGYAFLGGLLLVLGVLGWWAVLRDRFVWSSKRLR